MLDDFDSLASEERFMNSFAQRLAEAMMDSPAYPSVQGQAVPDLNLAGVSTPMTQLSPGYGGHLADSTPPQNLDVPPLACADPAADINQAGLDPSLPYFHLNLAGEDGIPSPQQLADPSGPSGINLPTFSEPNYAVPSMRAYDLTGPGIDELPFLQPDPLMPDLTAYDKPGGLYQLPYLAPDPVTDDLQNYDQPAGIDLGRDILAPDPLVPDLKNPDLTQDVMMPDRPADLAVGALDVIKLDPTDKAIDDVPYSSSFMEQRPNANSRRARHMNLLDGGMEATGR